MIIVCGRYVKGMYPRREEMEWVWDLFDKLTDREREVIMDKYCYECGAKLNHYRKDCKCGNKNLHGICEDKPGSCVKHRYYDK